jgi:Domain of unknown function (DUF4145)
MARDLYNDHYNELGEWFPENLFPTILCGICQDGYLVLEKVSTVELNSSLEEHAHPDWDPEWITGLHLSRMRCGNPKCKEIATTTGEYRMVFDIEYDERGNPQQTYSKELRINYVTPVSPLILKRDDYPDQVAQLIKEASAIALVSPGAAANRIRTAIDELLNAQKVIKIRTTKKGRARLTTHARILIFNAKNSEASDLLLAVKWIGNGGTHNDNISLSEVLDGVELFAHALDKLFNHKNIKLKKKAKIINDRKGHKAI